MKNIIAIIPARGGSKGIPKKNVRLLGGKPLIAHTIEHALRSKLITKTYVSTEDPEIHKVAVDFGADVVVRPRSLATDTAQVDPLLIHTAKDLEEQENLTIDLIVLLYPTAPFRKIETIDEAIQIVLDDKADSVLSLFEDTTYLWKRREEYVEPTNYDPSDRRPRQQEAWNQWAENKAVYVMKRDRLEKTGCRIHGRVGYVEMEKWRSIDIDTESDLILANALYDTLHRSNQDANGE